MRFHWVDSSGDLLRHLSQVETFETMEPRKSSGWCVWVARLIDWWNVGQSVPKWWLAVWKSPTVALPAGQIRFRLGCWPQFQPNGCTCKYRHTHTHTDTPAPSENVCNVFHFLGRVKCTILEHVNDRVERLTSAVKCCKRPLRNGSQTAAAVTRANGHCVKIASLKRYSTGPLVQLRERGGHPKRKRQWGGLSRKGCIRNEASCNGGRQEYKTQRKKDEALSEEGDHLNSRLPSHSLYVFSFSS